MEKDENKKNCPKLRLHKGRTSRTASMFHGSMRHLFNSNFVKKKLKNGISLWDISSIQTLSKKIQKWDFLKVELLLVKNCHIPAGFLLGMQVG
jgi:hypothetical protein